MEVIEMNGRPVEKLAAVIDRRTPVVEPLIVIGIASLITTWMIQPYVAQALTQQGNAALSAAQAALWFSGVLSPLAAFGKALAAALVCWACSVFLGERLPLIKLVSVFCIAEVVFSLRDVAMMGVLFARGVDGIRTAADLMVAFGVNVFIHKPSPLQRIGFETWDLFSVVWAAVVFMMLRLAFKATRPTAAALAILALVFRVLFSAAALLYSL
jgi:hypothetical protein